MARRLWLWMVWSVAVSLAPAGAAPAQEPAQPSHRPLSNEPEDLGQVEQALADRLRQAQDLHKMQKLAEELLKDNPDLLKSDKLKKLKEQYEKDPAKLLQDKTLAPFIQQAIKEREQSGDLTKEQAELLEKLKQKTSEGNGSATNPQQPDGQDPTQQAGTPEALPGQQGSQPPSQGNPAETSRGRNTWLTRELGKFVEEMSRQSPDGKNSWKDLVRQILEGKGNDSDGRQGAWTRFLPQVSKYLPWKNVSLRDLGSLLNDARLPRLPHFAEPSLPSLPAAPRFGADGPWQFLMWIILAAIGAVLVWRSLDWYRARQEALESSWHLGPWPVAPTAVRTRLDLVRAFEYLAFLLLGRDVRSCNHLDIAYHLGEQGKRPTPARRQAAEQLATLYEIARYAPDNEPLDEPDLAAARRDLCFLAGVTGA